jgi:flagellar biosynthesis/type III secretory pathway chaperone
MKSLETLLEGEHSTTARLLEALREEHQALVRRDMTALDHAVNKKSQQVAELEMLGRERDAALNAAGHAAGREGIESWLSRQPHGAAKKLWQELQNLLLRCQRQNLSNGAIVETSRRYTQRALSLLQGQSAEPALYYGPSGASGSATRSSLYTRI